MSLGKRQFFKWLDGFTVPLMHVGRCLIAVTARPRPATVDPLIGINTYYLMVEAYRRVKDRSMASILKTVEGYLKGELQLFELRDRSHLNTLRFWVYNDYPRPSGEVLPGAFDRRVRDMVNIPEWILSRSQLPGSHPWYIGKMGWCWPDPTRDNSPFPLVRLQQERM